MPPVNTSTSVAQPLSHKMQAAKLKASKAAAAAPVVELPSPPISPRDGIFEDDAGERAKFYSEIFAMLEENMTDTEAPVVKLATPEHLLEAIDLKIKEGPRAYGDIAKACRTILDYSVKTTHRHFHNQLYANANPAGIAGEFITAVSNASMYTYEVAPVYTVIENELLQRMRSLIGWEDGDGIFNPGGSMSNIYGMNLARYQKFQELGYNVKEDGLAGAPKLVCFSSSHAHYSITKSASLLGIGSKNIIRVLSDDQGRMIPEKLAEAVKTAKESGAVPFMIHCTAGTTVLGGYDDINHACDVAKEHGLWVHVDGCWGGSCVLSRTHRELVAGIERADSYAWNPHKMMGIPQQCAAFLVRHKGLLQAAHSANAKYLFQKDKLNACLDTGDKSIQCGRRNDALKLWMTWAAVGTSGYEAHIDNLWSCAKHLRDQVVAREGFELVTEPMCTNVSFWYLPPSLRKRKDVERMSPEWRKAVHEAAPAIKEEMQRKGSLMVGFQSIPLHNDPAPPNFFRMVVISMGSTKADMDYLLDEIESIGQDLKL